MIAGNKMHEKENTLIFLDEIQAYPHLLTLLKFLKQDDKFTYIASGSLLGVTLSKMTVSIPMGSIETKRMFPLDFEEFLIANGFNQFAIDAMHAKFLKRESLDEGMHNKVMDLFKKYLLVGGLPDAINSFLTDSNIMKVRAIQGEIHDYYGADASKYEMDSNKKLKVKRIFDMIPSSLENKKKRIVIKNIEGKDWKQSRDYQDEFDSLSVIPVEVKSGKDYMVHSALNGFLKNDDYGAKYGYVFSNERITTEKNKALYMPIYYVMFLKPDNNGK